MCRKLVSILLSALAAAASPTVGASVNGEGVKELFGNSFGIPGINATYDYVVIGGGTAGNTIAARLALDPANYSVAVIEAGSFYEILSGNRTQVPGYNFISAEPNFASGGLSSFTALSLDTVPQTGYSNRSISYTTGQTFGGGSAANYMGYSRPTIGSFKDWSEMVKDDFWSWDNVYPFFKKSCHLTPPDYTKIDSTLNITYDPNAFESYGGPLEVSYGNFQGPYGPSLEESLASLGFEALPGLNSGRLIGYGTITAAVDPRTATRSSSETSFLQAGAKSSGLKIYPDTLAKRIVFDSNKRATGVVVQGNMLTTDFEYQISASKEVIVSAGVWRSPQLLMVSGVGPAKTLSDHGIAIVADLPGVGQNERVS